MELAAQPEALVVCRLPPTAPWPALPADGRFVSATRTPTELSVVCPPELVPAGAEVEAGWRLLTVVGPLDFTLVGIMASLTDTLARAGVSVFVVSTFTTDHVLVKDASFGPAVDALRAAGHTITGDGPGAGPVSRSG
jgi:hypothetical protein